MKAHVRDPYVRGARVSGYRSRAAFKLIEIADRDHLLAPGMRVVDLGAAPGSWSQVAAERVGPGGKLIAVDRLAIEPMPGVERIQGDFRDAATRQRVAQALGGRKADVVISDLAPNLCGIAVTDQERSRELCELALEFAAEHLKPGGSMLVKAFQGTGFRDFLEHFRRCFETSVSRKPDASRDRSSELYLLGLRFRGRMPPPPQGAGAAST